MTVCVYGKGRNKRSSTRSSKHTTHTRTKSSKTRTTTQAQIPTTKIKPEAKVAGDTIVTESGLTFTITHHGTGSRLEVGRTVLVHYTGLLVNGTKFDSSLDRKDPIAFKLGAGQVIKGWDEGIAKMSIGDQAVLIIPPTLGYGSRGAGNVIPPNATLIFIVEVVDSKESTIADLLSDTMTRNGIDAALKQFYELKSENFRSTYMSESQLNGLGYMLLSRGKNKEAIQILKLNAETYPQSPNVYDSLGEAYLSVGDKDEAINNYRKSLKLDPNNKNAVEQLAKLGVTP